MRLRFAAHSEIGLVRKNNQDSGYASPNLLVVADGMGGAAAGDLASAVAVDAIRQVDEPISGEQMLEVLTGALRQANDRIAALVEKDYALEGMGTTVTGALFDGSQFGLAHIGDSRAYLLHNSRLERLTHDHSWVQSLVDIGRISETEAAVHPHRSLLLKVLNGQPANDPDVSLVRVEPGDRLLLCSDGLCGLVDDDVIEASMRTPDLQSALSRLVQEARNEGGVDNITVILADVVESGASEVPMVLGAAAELTLPSARTPASQTSAGQSAPESTAVDGDVIVEPDAADRPGQRPGAADPQATLGDDEARYSPQPPRSRPLVRSLVALVLAVLVVGGAMASAYAWTRTQYFVSAHGDQVAIFQGLDESLPGLKLSRLYEVQPLAVSALPPYYQVRVRASIDVSNLDAARRTVTELTDAAHRCAKTAPPASARPPASASASVGPSTVAPSVASTPARSTPAASPSAEPGPRASTSAQAAPSRSAAPASPPAAPRTPASAKSPAALPAPDC